MVSVCAIEEDALSAVHGVCCCCLVLWTGPVSKSSGPPLQTAEWSAEGGSIVCRAWVKCLRQSCSRLCTQRGRWPRINFVVPLKCFSSAPTNDAMLCVQEEVQLGGIKHGIGHSYRRFQLRSMQAKCILGGTDGQWRNGKIAESVAGWGVFLVQIFFEVHIDGLIPISCQ